MLPGRMSEGDSRSAKVARAELARRWADVSTSRRVDPAARLLQQSIQTRAMMMQRRAHQKMSSQASEVPRARGASPQAQFGGGSGSGATQSNGTQASSAPTNGECRAAQFEFEQSFPPPFATGPVLAGPVPPGPVPRGSVAASMTIPMMTMPVPAPVPVPRPVPPGPIDSGQRVQRLSSITNFELERLFTLTSSPAMAAAMRCGGWHAEQAATRLRETMVSQRQTTSEGFMRHWRDSDNSGMLRVPDPAEERARARVERDSAEAEAAKAQKMRAAEEALRHLPVEHVTAASAGDPCAICQEGMAVGEAVRRLPCAHLFHSECIARWLQVKLTCPLDALPVDEGIEMLAAATSTSADQGASVAERPTPRPPLPPCGVRPPPPSELAPLPAEEHPPPPPEPRSVAPSLPSPPCVWELPPIGLRELEAAAAQAGVSVDRVADALAQRRARSKVLVLE